MSTRKCPFCDTSCAALPADDCCHQGNCRCLKMPKGAWKCACTPFEWHMCPGKPSGDRYFVTRRSCYYEKGPLSECTWKHPVIIHGVGKSAQRLARALAGDCGITPRVLKRGKHIPGARHFVAVNLPRDEPPAPKCLSYMATGVPSDACTFVAIGKNAKDVHIRRAVVGDDYWPGNWSLTAFPKTADVEQVRKGLAWDHKSAVVYYADPQPAEEE